MSFLSPLILWALPAALIPLLAHFWIRRRGRKIQFSDLTLIRKLETNSLSRFRLKSALLIFLRCGILLALILAYAGPVRYGSQSGKSTSNKAGVDLAILVDESYSMSYIEGGQSRLALLKNKILQIMKRLKSQDRVLLIPFSDRVEASPDQIHWLNPQEAQSALLNIRPTFRGTDFRVPLNALSKLWSKQDANKKVALILSDSARHGIIEKIPELDPSVLWLGIDWGKTPSNSFIAAVKPKGDLAGPHPSLEALLHSENPTSITLKLLPNWNSKIAIKGSGELETSILNLPEDQNRQDFIAGEADLRADNLAADDSYFFSFSLPVRSKVLCLYGDPSFLQAPRSGYFIRKVLGESGNGILPYQTSFKELGPENEINLSGYRAVILAGFNTLPQKLEAQLKAFTRQGGGLWILPASNSPIEAFAELNTWAPAAIGPLVQGESPGIKVGNALLEKNLQGFNLHEISIESYHLLQLKPTATTIFKSASGYPLLSCDQKNPTCVSAFSLSIGASNLAAKPAFLAWMQIVLAKIAGGSAKIENFNLNVGENLKRTWGENEAAPTSAILKAPDGRLTKLYLKDRSIRSSELTMPGLYELRTENASRFYAVNADRSRGESDLTEISSPPWTLLPAQSWPEDFIKEIHGKKEDSLFLFLALLFVCAEMILAAPRSQNSLSTFFPKIKIPAAAIALILCLALPLAAQNSESLVWTQIKIGPDWDPYPNVYTGILSFVSTLTSVYGSPDRRVITLKDPGLFSSPLIILAGKRAPNPLSADEVKTLNDYLRAGGLLWIEDSSGISGGPFEMWTRQTLKRVFPQLSLAPVKPDDVLFKTFFLLRQPGGLLMMNPALLKLDYDGRAAVIYSRNDLLGIWEKDALGNPLYPAIPGGEAQRENGKRLVLNIILYALTGDYKADAVHQPYLLQKMRSGVP